ncbi:MAG: spermidine synthase [Limisphaerales bacterium]|jgi:spermidine synthase
MPVFALTIFIGAFLLFQVQPLIGKYILPWFGGSPAVWTTCMLFFQVLLLGGYAYAHWLSSWVKPQKQAALHILLLLAAVTLLPITPADSWKPEPGTEPTGHILLLLLASIGLPYFVLSSTGPLMQKWFSWIHPGRSPYSLYALSNVGSLLALLSFPFYFESEFSRRDQSGIWSVGLMVFVVFCAWCAARLWIWGRDNENPELAAGGQDQSEVEPVTRRQVGLWLMLSASASALLLATTNKLTQDVAVIPFLWVLPLAIYLLTFIFCFAEIKIYWRRVFLPLFVLSIASIITVIEQLDTLNVFWQIGGFSVLLFSACMICHGELVRLKPDPRFLTRFYLMISVGGALGGFFVAVLAPIFFVTYVEFHWTLWLAAVLGWIACHPRAQEKAFELWHFKVWYAGGVTVLAISVGLYWQARDKETNVVTSVRNFYGSMAVLEYEEDDDEQTPYLLLRHGRITHGFQVMAEGQRDYVTSYYGMDSGVGIAIDLLPQTTNRVVGVVGLGTGTMAAYGKPGDVFRFYEINPEVVRLARDHFTFLDDSAARVDVALGDARLNMEKEESQQFDLLALDAFSSDAIPVHLLTKEAFALYERQLKTNGCLAIHISNRYLDLEPVVRNAAELYGYHVAIISDENLAGNPWVYESTWMILNKDPILVEAIQTSSLGEEMEPSDVKVALWTDDYTSLYPILYRSGSEEYDEEDFDETEPAKDKE